MCFKGGVPSALPLLFLSSVHFSFSLRFLQLFPQVLKQRPFHFHPSLIKTLSTLLSFLICNSFSQSNLPFSYVLGLFFCSTRSQTFLRTLSELAWGEKDEPVRPDLSSTADWTRTIGSKQSIIDEIRIQKE